MTDCQDVAVHHITSIGGLPVVDALKIHSRILGRIEQFAADPDLIGLYRFTLVRVGQKGAIPAVITGFALDRFRARQTAGVLDADCMLFGGVMGRIPGQNTQVFVVRSIRPRPVLALPAPAPMLQINGPAATEALVVPMVVGSAEIDDAPVIDTVATESNAPTMPVVTPAPNVFTFYGFVRNRRDLVSKFGRFATFTLVRGGQKADTFARVSGSALDTLTKMNPDEQTRVKLVGAFSRSQRGTSVFVVRQIETLPLSVQAVFISNQGGRKVVRAKVMRGNNVTSLFDYRHPLTESQTERLCQQVRETLSINPMHWRPVA